MPRQIPSTFMLATTAIHQLGDISRAAPDLCVVFQEDDENYYGNWVTGFGLFGVRFPKATTRRLTDEEKAAWDGREVEYPWGIVPLRTL